MKLDNPLDVIRRRIRPTRHEKIEKALKVTAGTAAAVWMVLRLKRELYGPGGTKMSRYDRHVDKVWDRR